MTAETVVKPPLVQRVLHYNCYTHVHVWIDIFYVYNIFNCIIIVVLCSKCTLKQGNTCCKPIDLRLHFLDIFINSRFVNNGNKCLVAKNQSVT